MKSFKEFLRECLLNERYDSLNDYRHSIGLPDEDIIDRTQDAIHLQHIAMEDPKKNQGIQSSVEDEARRRMAIEDDVMRQDEPFPFEPRQDWNTPSTKAAIVTSKIQKAILDMNTGNPKNHGSVYARRLKQTMDNIVNDRKVQFPDLAKEQEELDWKREKLKQKRNVVATLSNLLPPPVIPPSAPSPPVAATNNTINYFKNLLDTEFNKISKDVTKNTEKQNQMPFSMEYGRFENKYGVPVIPQFNPEFEQTRTFTDDSDLASPQENEQGIRLGRVDYSRKNK